jgi:hypothetical protein
MPTTTAKRRRRRGVRGVMGRGIAARSKCIGWLDTTVGVVRYYACYLLNGRLIDRWQSGPPGAISRFFTVSGKSLAIPKSTIRLCAT